MRWNTNYFFEQLIRVLLMFGFAAVYWISYSGCDHSPKPSQIKDLIKPAFRIVAFLCFCFVVKSRIEKLKWRYMLILRFKGNIDINYEFELIRATSISVTSILCCQIVTQIVNTAYYTEWFTMQGRNIPDEKEKELNK